MGSAQRTHWVERSQKWGELGAASKATKSQTTRAWTDLLGDKQVSPEISLLYFLF